MPPLRGKGSEAQKRLKKNGEYISAAANARAAGEAVTSLNHANKTEASNATLREARAAEIAAKQDAAIKGKDAVDGNGTGETLAKALETADAADQGKGEFNAEGAAKTPEEQTESNKQREIMASIFEPLTKSQRKILDGLGIFSPENMTKGGEVMQKRLDELQDQHAGNATALEAAQQKLIDGTDPVYDQALRDAGVPQFSAKNMNQLIQEMNRAVDPAMANSAFSKFGNVLKSVGENQFFRTVAYMSIFFGALWGIVSAIYSNYVTGCYKYGGNGQSTKLNCGGGSNNIFKKDDNFYNQDENAQYCICGYGDYPNTGEAPKCLEIPYQAEFGGGTFEYAKKSYAGAPFCLHKDTKFDDLMVPDSEQANNDIVNLGDKYGNACLSPGNLFCKGNPPDKNSDWYGYRQGSIWDFTSDLWDFLKNFLDPNNLKNILKWILIIMGVIVACVLGFYLIKYLIANPPKSKKQKQIKDSGSGKETNININLDKKTEEAVEAAFRFISRYGNSF